VADVIPRRTRSERRPTGLLLKDLDDIARLARTLGVVSEPDDFDTGLTTDDMM